MTARPMSSPRWSMAPRTSYPSPTAPRSSCTAWPASSICGKMQPWSTSSAMIGSPVFTARSSSISRRRSRCAPIRSGSIPSSAPTLKTSSCIMMCSASPPATVCSARSPRCSWSSRAAMRSAAASTPIASCSCSARSTAPQTTITLWRPVSRCCARRRTPL